MTRCIRDHDTEMKKTRDETRCMRDGDPVHDPVHERLEHERLEVSHAPGGA